MKIFDCFTFHDELEILDIRLNTLNKFVDKFIIVESAINHQGKSKKINFNINLFKRFESKINYFLIKEFPKNYSSWQIENYQRNQISNGLKNCTDEDIIIISDVDEIPNLNNFDFFNLREKIYVFEQDLFYYKLNLRLNQKWLGTKLCKYKYLKSPQWLRQQKTHKKYSLWRIDKIFSKTYTSKFQIIQNGGWHFTWMKSIDNILLKINSYAHTENKKFAQKSYLEDCINRRINFLNTNEKLEIVNINKNFPDYIFNNQNLFREWIEK